MPINFLFLALIALRLVIGIALVNSARKYKLENLYWLAAVFFINFLTLPFASMAGNPLGNLRGSLWIFYANTFSTFALVWFIHTTFCKGRSSIAKWLLGLQAAGLLALFYGLINTADNFRQSPWLASAPILNSLAWAWHAWVAYNAQRTVTTNEQVEDWVKARYAMMTAYSVTSFAAPLATAIRIIFAGGGNANPLGMAMGVSANALTIISVTLQFLVWVMPEWFRKWLNRNQQAHAAERIHEHAQAILDIIGDAMAHDSGLSKMMAVFAVRKTIGMEIKTEDAVQVEARAASMGFEEWSALLNHPELYLLLKNLAHDKQTEILEKARRTLLERQSLFTMQTK